MPAYDVRCDDCGVNEIIATPSEARAGELRCGYCRKPSPQVFSPANAPHARIDAGGEDAAMSKRVQDGTAQFNMGLPGVETRVGTRADGKAKTEYRPITNRELGSNAGVREYAKRHGLTPIEGGRYRTTPR